MPLPFSWSLKGCATSVAAKGERDIHARDLSCLCNNRNHVHELVHELVWLTPASSCYSLCTLDAPDASDCKAQDTQDTRHLRTRTRTRTFIQKQHHQPPATATATQGSNSCDCQATADSRAPSCRPKAQCDRLPSSLFSLQLLFLPLSFPKKR